MKSAVKSPNHYCLYENVEVIDIIKAALSGEEFKGYCKGNIIKYRMRAGLKGTAEQDIKKSYEYKNYLENGTKADQAERAVAVTTLTTAEQASRMAGFDKLSDERDRT